MNFYLTLLALVVIVLLIGYYYFQKWKAGRNPPAPRHRMLIAIKRRHASMVRFLELEAEEQEQQLELLDENWNALTRQYSFIGEFVGGFTGPASGLPSGTDEGWTILRMYDLPNLDAFERCKDILESPLYAHLRNHCDIRLLVGINAVDSDGLLRRLF